MNVRPSLSEVLDLCMERVLLGESVEDCVADYPEYEAELRDELEAAALFNQAFAVPVNQDAKRAARLRMHAALDKKANPGFSFGSLMPRGLFATGTRIAATAAVAGLALVFSGTGTVMASQGALPGDVLYPVKRTTEQVMLALAFSDSREASVRTGIIERRADELVALAEDGQEQFVAELVADLIDQTARVQALATAPVEQAVQQRPTREPTQEPTKEPTATPDDRRPTSTPEPTTTPSPASGQETDVALAPVLTLKQGFDELEARVAGLDGLTEEAMAEIDKLKLAIEQNRGQLKSLLDRADPVTVERSREEPDDQDDPSVPTATPTPTPTTEPSDPGANGRRTAIVWDVRLVKDRAGNELITIKAVLDDGSGLTIYVGEGGARLIKDGDPAGLSDLAIGQRLTLGFDRRTGEVTVAAITDAPLVREDSTGDASGNGRGKQNQVLPFETATPRVVPTLVATTATPKVPVKVTPATRTIDEDGVKTGKHDPELLQPLDDDMPTPRPGDASERPSLERERESRDAEAQDNKPTPRANKPEPQADEATPAAVEPEPNGRAKDPAPRAQQPMTGSEESTPRAEEPAGTTRHDGRSEESNGKGKGASGG